jgi:hypothetical protein
MPSPAERKKSNPSVLSMICGILAAVAAGFLFDNQFQNMANHHHDASVGLIEAGIFAAVFVITGFLTGWK